MADLFSIDHKKIWIAGHRGLVGSALVRRLSKENCEIVTVAREELDLRSQPATDQWIEANRPDVIIIAAAKVGGISANALQQADFLYDNLAIAQNIIYAAAQYKTEKLVFLGSSCIYPRLAKQPISEEALLTGALEPTNEAYAIAKIAGLKLCQYYRQQYGYDFISLMPCNLYGPGDRWNSDDAHVIPSLISKIHQAKLNQTSAFIWGSGDPLREFLHADDAAHGIVHALQHYSRELPLNLGSGREVSIRDLSYIIKEIVGFQGNLEFDSSKPDGVRRKLLNSSRMHALGWEPKISLEVGLEDAYRDFLSAR